MRIGSLFSGIGGLELGLERAGVGHTVWQIEKDPYCRQVLAKHWPDAARYEDVTTTDWSQLEPVEVLCGGFPCQPVAQNGHRLGEDDDRWLWPWFAHAIRELRPDYVVVENVGDLAVRGMPSVVGDLAACGYDAQWQRVSAADIGAPHRRERLFILAYRDGVGREEAPRVLLPGACQNLVEPSPWGSLSRGGVGGRVRRVPDPSVFRVADGFPTAMDGARVGALGNAVVPQVAEAVGRRLMELATS